ncbi:MAG: uroporphyrinogen-III C-methyltransferase [Gammaproteobacteria bacterium]|nr:uroporphyrinogen-III C-methyltransferase [Gammaproteobacteria bacterium]
MTPINTKQSRENASNPKRGGAGFGILLTLLISSAAAITSYWAWQQSNIRDEVQNELEGGVSQLLEAIELQRKTVDRRFTIQQNHQHDQLQQRILALETKLAQAEQPIRLDHWSVAEAIYLINIAEHHYRLEQNSVMAINALEQAHRRLLDHASPEMAPILEQMNRITIQLKQSGGEKRQQQLAQLATLSSQIPELPIIQNSFVMTSENGSADDYSLKSIEGWRQFGSTLSTDIQKLFRITRPDNSDTEQNRLITADIYPLLRQQLILKIELVRLALMSNSAILTNEAKASISLLERYFDSDSELVRQQIAILSEIAATGEQQPIDFDALRQQLLARGSL